MAPPPRSQQSTLKSFRLLRCGVINIMLFIAFLSVKGQAIAVSNTGDAGVPFPHQSAAVNNTEECPWGRIFVYSIPPMLNRDLVKQYCTDLNQSNTECGIVSNAGYGGDAAELRQILPDHLSKLWYHTDPFSFEVLFHDRILMYKCRTMESKSAAAFYIPFYAALAVEKYLWTNEPYSRDRHAKLMLRLMMERAHWRKSNGSSHFLGIGRSTWDLRRVDKSGWGSSFLNMPLMKNVTRLIVEKDLSDEMDVTVPYLIGFHPTTRESLIDWQSFAGSYNRSTLFTLITDNPNWADSGYCSDEAESCRVVDCSSRNSATNSSAVLSALLESEFCLEQMTDKMTCKSLILKCMVAGSVPVFFTKTFYEQYQWFLPSEPKSYSVFIDPDKLKNCTVHKILNAYTNQEITNMRAKVIESIPKLIYSKSTGGEGGFKDAFDVAIDRFFEESYKKRHLNRW